MSDTDAVGALTQTIITFIQTIGITVRPDSITSRTFVPGIFIDHGTLVIDKVRLRFPGDILHEAGHLAVIAADRRDTITGNVGSNPTEEMMAIAWSYAAAVHLQIDLAVVFHPEGYRGASAAIIENFQNGRYFAVPMLQWLGMTYDDVQAPLHNVAPFPHMLHWLRPRQDT